MTSIIENHAVESVPTAVHLSEGSRPFGLRAPVFLMINSFETGGTERQFVELSRALRAADVALHLGCIQKEGGFASEAADAEEFRLGGSLYGLQSLRSRWRLARHLRSLGIQVAHSFDFYTNLTMIPAARLARVPVVIGSHRQLGDLLTTAQFRAQLAVFRMADRVVCNSHAAAMRLVEAGLPERKLRVIGNALPATAFSQAAPALPRVEGRLRVGMIARMNAAYKNHSAFLRAAARLAARFRDIEFLLAGDGSLRPDLERQAVDLGIANRVRFLGDRRDIREIMASLDVAVVPSTSESLSNVMLESMAAGVPLVATSVGGNIEIGGEGRALLVPAGDDSSLEQGIGAILQDSALRSRMSDRAREFVSANFSVERIRQQYEKLYIDTLQEKNDSGREHSLDLRRRPQAKIRIALVAPSLRYVGGQAVQADLLMRHWENDAEVAASFVAVDPRLPLGLRWTERLPGLRTAVRSPLYAWALWRGISGVDLVHIFSASYSSFLLAPLPAWLIARMRGKKTLINYRSGEARDHLRKSWIARRVLRATDRVIVPSGYLVDVFHEFGLDAQAVANIVDLSQFKFRVRNPVRPDLICTRGFHPYYGIDVLVKAFAEVKQAYPDAQLSLVGGGAEEANIRSLVDSLRLSGVRFAGVASRQQIGALYDEADIFVNASNLDNMPVSVLEAFAAGTPVVTTAPEGMKYIVTHEQTGLLSAPGDVSALAQNILRMLKEPELSERMARKAFEQSSAYRWEAVRKQWLKVYSDLSGKSAEQRNQQEV
jgi:glycosyltransferase involved in cell wall biosynthesis